MNHLKTPGRVSNTSLVALCAGFLAGILATGCDIPQRPVLDPADARRPIGAGAKDSSGTSQQQALEVPRDSFVGPWETWDAYFIRNRHVGYAHVVADSAEDANQVKYTLESRLLVKQGRARLQQRLSQTSTETSDGHLLGFESVLRVGPAVTRFNGSVNKQNLEIEVIRGSSKTTRRVPWQDEYYGLTALEQSLRQRPMLEKGEQRNLMMLLPGQYQLATIRLRCAGKALVPLIDGTPGELLEINCEIRAGDQKTYSTIWTDDKGAIVRTFSPDLNLVAYRTDEATATNLPRLDSAVASIGVGGKRIARPSEANRVAFKITPNAAARQSGKPIQFEPAPGQYVRSVDDGSVQVLVSRRLEDVAHGFVAAELAVSDADLQPNQFIDSNATLVRRLADAAVAAKGVGEREIAVELTKTVHKLIDEKPEAAGFSKASEVVQDGVGGTTARAILLAAMLRARKIPARLAIGLKYSSAEEGGEEESDSRTMSYHVWTLAHADGSWINLDATEGNPAAADRLIISTTNLSGGKEHEALLPLLEALGNIEIDVVGQG